MTVPASFDITFKIIEFIPENDILVIQCHSSILKGPADSYPPINLGTRNIDLEGNVKEQILMHCRGIIEDIYRKENRNVEKEQSGIEFIQQNLQKPVTVEAENNNSSDTAVVPAPMSKIRFI